MKALLFRFGYESPTEFANNTEHGWDDQSSSAIWIVCDNEAEALSWGEKVADAFVAWLFSSTDDKSYAWSEVGYASWIEKDERELKSAFDYRLIPMVKFGEFPEFTALAPLRGPC